MDKKLLLKYALLLFFAVVLCAFVVRIFSGNETLLEYADKNPEIAYQEKEPEQAPAHMDNINEPPIDGQPTDAQESNAGQDTEPNDSPAETAAEDPTDIGGSVSSNSSPQESEANDMTMNPERTVYKEGFYYEPLSEELIKRITGISYPITEAEKDSAPVKATNTVASAEDIQISYDDLRYVSVLHYNFKGIVRTGELICNKAIAQDMVEIFYELYQNQYQIEQMHLIDEYSGDDTLSMQDNNTSCFNYRLVEGTDNLSKHAMGLAIDINPFFNPYVVYREDGTAYISPQGSEAYADRSKDFAYKIDENDLCYKLFTEHGFTWGGHWNSMKDYQHFQKVPE